MGLGDMEETISLSNPLSKFSVLLSLVDVPYWVVDFQIVKTFIGLPMFLICEYRFYCVQLCLSLGSWVLHLELFTISLHSVCAIVAV